MSEEAEEKAAIIVGGGGDDVDDDDEADVTKMLDLSKKKKKKKKTDSKTTGSKKDGSNSAATGTSASTTGGTTTGTKGTTTTATTTTTTTTSGLTEEMKEMQRQLLMEQDAAQELDDVDDVRAEYTYDVLLDRVVDLLHANNPDLVEKKRTRIKPPQLQMIGSRKTMWVNFQEICSMMQRDSQHVNSFLMAELGTEGSIDGNDRLIIRGRYLPKYIESLLRKYVLEYVTCEMCRSPNTLLERDQSSRLYFVNCKDCGSQRSVATVRTGYHATSRADRRAARNAKQ
jgi:translation initiation factor 2 subunit 2